MVDVVGVASIMVVDGVWSCNHGDACHEVYDDYDDEEEEEACTSFVHDDMVPLVVGVAQ
jgi:hypothetical protein